MFGPDHQTGRAKQAMAASRHSSSSKNRIGRGVWIQESAYSEWPAARGSSAIPPKRFPPDLERCLLVQMKEILRGLRLIRAHQQRLVFYTVDQIVGVALDSHKRDFLRSALLQHPLPSVGIHSAKGGKVHRASAQRLGDSISCFAAGS